MRLFPGTDGADGADGDYESYEKPRPNAEETDRKTGYESLKVAKRQGINWVFLFFLLKTRDIARKLRN